MRLAPGAIGASQDRSTGSERTRNLAGNKEKPDRHASLVALETVAIPALDVKKAREIDSAPPSHGRGGVELLGDRDTAIARRSIRKSRTGRPGLFFCASDPSKVDKRTRSK
jgi:hypothetical protein